MEQNGHSNMPHKSMVQIMSFVVITTEIMGAQYRNKNSAEVDIAPASGKISKNIKYRSRSAGLGACLKGMSRTITMQGFKLAAITDAEKTKLRRKN